jgi:hypothetical protein
MRLKQNQNDLTRLLKYSFVFVFLINENDSFGIHDDHDDTILLTLFIFLSQIVKAIKFDNKYLLA